MDVGFWEAHKKPFCFFMDNLRLLYFLRYTTYKKKKIFQSYFFTKVIFQCFYNNRPACTIFHLCARC